MKVMILCRTTFRKSSLRNHWFVKMLKALKREIMIQWNVCIVATPRDLLSWLQ